MILLCYPIDMKAPWRRNAAVFTLAMFAAGFCTQHGFAVDGSAGASRLPPEQKAQANKGGLNEADLKNPLIVNPDETWDPCDSVPRSASEIDKLKSDAQTYGIKIGNKCMPQADAFTEAAEASSYLAFYQKTMSQYAANLADPEIKAKINDAIQSCILGKDDCDQSKQQSLLAALVQYNFGRELRANVMENRKHAEEMKSLDPGAQYWRETGYTPTKILSWKNSRSGGTIKKHSFRINPNSLPVYDPIKTSPEDRRKLGSEFNQTFNQFVEGYTAPVNQRGLKSRWYYVPPKSSGDNDSIVKAFDPEINRDGSMAVDSGKLRTDLKQEMDPKVREIVESYKNNFKDALAKPQIEVHGEGKKDTIQMAYQTAGFGLQKKTDPSGEEVSPALIAQNVVMTINKEITKQEDEMQKKNASDIRYPSSDGNKPTKSGQEIIPSLVINIAEFDKFLDDVWPPSASKRQ